MQRPKRRANSTRRKESMMDEQLRDTQDHALGITQAFGLKSRLIYLKYWGKKRADAGVE